MYYSIIIYFLHRRGRIEVSCIVTRHQFSTINCLSMRHIFTYSRPYLNFSGLATLMDAASPHFVQNVKISGDPVAIIEPNGRIFPSLVKLPICPEEKASFPHALQFILSFSI